MKVNKKTEIIPFHSKYILYATTNLPDNEHNLETKNNEKLNQNKNLKT